MKTAIIIPTFNNANTIIRAIRSVLENTIQPNTIIIGDCNSSDRTFRYITEFFGINDKSEFSYHNINIKLFRLQTDNIINVLNICYQMVEDDEITGFLNPGDIYHKNKIETSLGYFKLDNNILAVVNDFKIERKRYLMHKFCEPFDSIKFGKENIYDNNFMAKTEIIKRINGFDINIDFTLSFINLLQKIATLGLIYHIPEFLTTKL